ncbi:MAG: HupE/UreJ family protein [Pseudomonadales bacterium]
MILPATLRATLRALLRAFGTMVLLALSVDALAHNLSASNASFVEALNGPAIVPFLYLGAKHMVTGYDHLLFLIGVVFFLREAKDIVLYVSLFTLGHSITLLGGVLAGWQVNAYLIDAVIGLSVVYKAFENMGGFDRLGRWKPDTRAAVGLFGLCHGLGLATKLQDLTLTSNGLITNMVSFNVGVELGQLAALALILLLLMRWRSGAGFERQAFAANAVLMTCGFLLAGYQLGGLVLES